jgi:hypothetical protein
VLGTLGLSVTGVGTTGKPTFAQSLSSDGVTDPRCASRRAGKRKLSDTATVWRRIFGNNDIVEYKASVAFLASDLRVTVGR